MILTTTVGDNKDIMIGNVNKNSLSENQEISMDHINYADVVRGKISNVNKAIGVVH